MTEKEGDAVSNETAGVDADAMYQVRIIHSWPPPGTSSPLDKSLASSFYGLQLELRGKVKDRSESPSPFTLFNDGESVSKAGEIREAIAVPLAFDKDSAPSTARLEPLDAITGPFEVVVLGKVSVSDDSSSATLDGEALAALHSTSIVQVENTLLEINGERFLVDRGATGADIYRRLWAVASRASLATPYELTLRRHNLAQVSAKIVPFARRKDVQAAQIAQSKKLAAQEAALPLNIRRKKLFLIQQLDFEREHYLVAYVSGPLQELHTKIMGDDKWQAYEFGKTLWYFHAPTARLCAQHPLRSYPEARQLIEQVQQQVQQAVQRIQRKTRSRQRRLRLIAAIQEEIRRNEKEKLDAARRIQHHIRSRQRKKRFRDVVQAVMKQQEELRREQQLAEKRRREEQRAEEIRQEELRQLAEQRQHEEQRAEESRQLEMLKQERQELLQDLDELKLELRQLQLLKATKSPVHSETQTSARHQEDSAAETIRKEEKHQLQQRLEQLKLELRTRKEVKQTIEMETQTSSENVEDLRTALQQKAQQRIEELELKLQQNTKVVTESVTQTSGRRGDNVRDEGVDTGEDLEWQRYLALLRVTIKNKKNKSPVRSRPTQTDSFDGEKTILASSMLRAPQNAVSFSSSRKFNGEWKGYPSWQRGSRNNSSNCSNNSSTSSLLALKSSLSQFDEFAVMAPPTRTFDSFFSPDLIMANEQPPPPLVDHPWRHDPSFLPLKSSRKMVEVTSIHPPLTLQLREPTQPNRTTGKPFQNSPASSPTKLPYITRRQKQVAGSPS